MTPLVLIAGVSIAWFTAAAACGGVLAFLAHRLDRTPKEPPPTLNLVVQEAERICREAAGKH